VIKLDSFEDVIKRYAGLKLPYRQVAAEPSEEKEVVVPPVVSRPAPRSFESSAEKEVVQASVVEKRPVLKEVTVNVEKEVLVPKEGDEVVGQIGNSLGNQAVRTSETPGICKSLECVILKLNSQNGTLLFPVDALVLIPMVGQASVWRLMRAGSKMTADQNAYYTCVVPSEPFPAVGRFGEMVSNWKAIEYLLHSHSGLKHQYTGEGYRVYEAGTRVLFKPSRDWTDVSGGGPAFVSGGCQASVVTGRYCWWAFDPGKKAFQLMSNAPSVPTDTPAVCTACSAAFDCMKSYRDHLISAHAMESETWRETSGDPGKYFQLIAEKLPAQLLQHVQAHPLEEDFAVIHVGRGWWCLSDEGLSLRRLLSSMGTMHKWPDDSAQRFKSVREFLNIHRRSRTGFLGRQVAPKRAPLRGSRF
jgi:hypothetical protein